MPTYTPPVKDLQFVLHDVLNVTASTIPGYDELEADFTSAILQEAGKLTSDVLAPLNVVGDKEGCRLENGVVYTPKGFKEAIIFSPHSSCDLRSPMASFSSSRRDSISAKRALAMS